MLLLVAFFVLVVALLLACHNRRQKLLREDHQKRLVYLSKDIGEQQGQVAYRQLMLNNYDFLKYNLKDALVVQQEIEL